MDGLRARHNVVRTTVYAAMVLACVSAIATSIEKPARRIISLSPHLTELVFAAGAGERLVGVVEYSDFPEQAQSLPRVGDAFRLDLERIVQLEPDLILAWKSGNSPRMIEQLADLDLEVVTLEPAGLEGIATDLITIGQLAGTEGTARDSANGFLADLEAVEYRGADVTTLRVFYQIQDRPLFTINGAHVISLVIELCGGVNIFADLDRLAISVSREAVLARDPEVILAGYPADQTLERWREFPGLSAVRADNLFGVDANLIARATPRIVDGAEQVCTALDEARRSLSHLRSVEG